MQRSSHRSVSMHKSCKSVHHRVSRLLKLTKDSARAGGAELHNIGALTGGIVSQEIIKAITEQYVPVDNTCVFDGIKSKSTVFKV
jgi:amyloid beta precursor protein binding protein 1